MAAIDKDTAEEALSLIDVVYEELPAVFDPLEALKPEAPLIHPDYASYEAPETKALSCATCRACCARKRAMAKAFNESDKVFEQTFQTQMVHQGYIEPYACSLEIDGEGCLSKTAV